MRRWRGALGSAGESRPDVEPGRAVRLSPVYVPATPPPQARLAWAARKGLKPAVRLNGTTDIRFENIAVEYMGKRFENIFQAFPAVQF